MKNFKEFVSDNKDESFRKNRKTTKEKEDDLAFYEKEIKKEMKKLFPDIEIVRIEKRSFGIFSIKVKQERAKSTRKGFILAQTTDVDDEDKLLDFDKKITWSN